MLPKAPYLLFFATLACSPDQNGAQTSMPLGDVVVSLTGDTLRPVPLPEDLRLTRQEQLDNARAAYQSDPTNADSIIWYGRRLAYMGRYQEAIAVYTEGIDAHPEDARMYRHRGHRFITIRNLDAALEDLARAASLVEGHPDEIEPDGLPNALNIPRSTLQSNIWYHLGLAKYLQGDFAGAFVAFDNGLDVSENDDMFVATSYWYYMTVAQSEGLDAAASILEPITGDMDVIENESYQRLLLLFKGELSVDSVLNVSDEDDVALASATVTYGVGEWHALHGRMDRAREVWEDTVRGTQWAAFGYIAAEAELAHASSPSS